MDLDKLAFDTNFPIDKIVSDFDGNTTTHSVAAATLSGGFYLPKFDTLTIANPYGKKGLLSLMYSYDGGTNYYPNKLRLYNPGNPVPSGRLGAAVGGSCDDSNITFYFTHYIGSQVDFIIKWTLDTID